MEGVLFTKISREGTKDLIVFNSNYSKEELRTKLNRIGSADWVDEILGSGYYFPENKIFEVTFDAKGRITTQSEEQSWRPFKRGDKILLYPDGRFETVPSFWEEIHSMFLYWNYKFEAILNNLLPS